jgi:hypothetical protein
LKLFEIAKLVRSKNAGPFFLTIDILFANQEIFQKVKACGVLNEELISIVYGIPLEEVQGFSCDYAMALKFSFPRPVAAGDFMDTDVFGGQQHGPLVNLEIPIEMETVS